MGDVVLTMKIMPESTDVDMDSLAESIKSTAEKHSKYLKHEVQPIAFGLNAVILYVQVPDGEGGSEALEEALANVKDVRSVEVTGMTRV